jgi:hypothetical protein
MIKFSLILYLIFLKSYLKHLFIEENSIIAKLYKVSFVTMDLHVRNKHNLMEFILLSYVKLIYEEDEQLLVEFKLKYQDLICSLKLIKMKKLHFENLKSFLFKTYLIMEK